MVAEPFAAWRFASVLLLVFSRGRLADFMSVLPAKDSAKGREEDIEA